MSDAQVLVAEIFDVCYVPLRNREGEKIAEALVDAADFERVMAEGRWSLAKRGYVYRRAQVEKKQVECKLHRFVLGLTPADPMVDHINRNPLDNRRVNLRLATNAQNSQNRIGKSGSSIYRGVYWDSGVKKWRAQHTLNSQTIYIGIFIDELEAAHAARDWRREFMPFADPEELYYRA